MPEEFAPRGLEQPKVSAVVHMVSHGAIGISNAVSIGEVRHGMILGATGGRKKRKLERRGRHLNWDGDHKIKLIPKSNDLLRRRVLRVCCDHELGLAAGDFAGDRGSSGCGTRVEQAAAPQV